MMEISWDVQPAGFTGVPPHNSIVNLSGSPLSGDQDTVYNYTLVAIDTENGCESEPISKYHCFK